jgi:plasmid stability protein
MANLTIAVDKELLKRARVKAIEEGTSVNAVLRDYLERYVGAGTTDAALAAFADLARQSTASSGPQGRSWDRDELHARSVER